MFMTDQELIDFYKTSPYSLQFEAMAKNFYENYETLVSYAVRGDAKVFLGDKENRTCRFCGKTHPEVTFKKEAHALSHMIGNNRLFSYYECDKCNGELFSKMESHFGNFMNFYHSVLGVCGKRGIPSYKQTNDAFSRIDNEGGKINLKQKEDEPELVSVDKEKKCITIRGKQNFVPLMVYKCLLKMALTVMPESELDNVQFSFGVLMSKVTVSEGLKVLFKFYRQQFEVPTCFIFKRKSDAKKLCPEYAFYLAYSNFSFLMPIYSDTDKRLVGQTISLIDFPCPQDLNEHPIARQVLDLTSSKKVVNEPVAINMGFESIEEVNLDVNRIENDSDKKYD